MSEEHEMEELKEAAEHGREHSKLAPVSFTMAILAVLVAVAALLSHRPTPKKFLCRTKPPTSGAITRRRTSAAIR